MSIKFEQLTIALDDIRAGSPKVIYGVASRRTPAAHRRAKEAFKQVLLDGGWDPAKSGTIVAERLADDSLLVHVGNMRMGALVELPADTPRLPKKFTVHIFPKGTLREEIDAWVGAENTTTQVISWKTFRREIVETLRRKRCGRIELIKDPVMLTRILEIQEAQPKDKASIIKPQALITLPSGGVMLDPDFAKKFPDEKGQPYVSPDAIDLLVAIAKLPRAIREYLLDLDDGIAMPTKVQLMHLVSALNKDGLIDDEKYADYTTTKRPSDAPILSSEERKAYLEACLADILTTKPDGKAADVLADEIDFFAPVTHNKGNGKEKDKRLSAEALAKKVDAALDPLNLSLFKHLAMIRDGHAGTRPDLEWHVRQLEASAMALTRKVKPDGTKRTVDEALAESENISADAIKKAISVKAERVAKATKK